MEVNISTWFPIASISDLPYRHVFQGQLLGREYAVWRADDGNINIWENRCLHRGVRLSIGINEGQELKCQYHGWRYANRTAGCTYIPAHPADAPARTICNNTYPCQEKYGMVWTCESPDNDIPHIENFDNYTVLRPVSINSSYSNVENFLNNNGVENHLMIQCHNGIWCFKDKKGNRVSFIIQPQSSNISILRGLINQSISGDRKLKVLRKYNSIVTRLSREIESNTTTKNPEMRPKIANLTAELSAFPKKIDLSQTYRLRVLVSEKVSLSNNIIKLKLKSIRERLPTFQAGSHIDIKLQNGLIRQYSLTNGPGETDHYCIAVKVDENGKGGSKTIAKNLAVGDVLAISSPHNNFPLLRNSTHTIFIAGGIGITPLLSMAKVMLSMKLSYDFHYFTKSQDRFAFEDDLKILKSTSKIYTDLSVKQTISRLKSIIGQPRPSHKIYVCGPGAMIESTKKLVSNAVGTIQIYGLNTSKMKIKLIKNQILKLS